MRKLYLLRIGLVVLAVLCGLCTTYAAGAQAPAGPAPQQQELALRGVCLAAAFCASATGETQLEPQRLAAGGCYIWQQPGVALVPTARWEPGAPPPELWLDAARLAGFLNALPELDFAEPPEFPREEDLASGKLPAPAVYALDAGQARHRLVRYIHAYEHWVALNTDPQSGAGSAAAAEWILVDEQAAQAVELALVYLDSAGPLEFYFTRDAEGKLQLAHFFNWYFFSA